MMSGSGPSSKVWKDVVKSGKHITVRVKTLGQVGDGKSTLCNDLVEVFDKNGKFTEVFKTGDGVRSVNSGRKDGDGFGGLGKKIEDVTEENLRDIKDKPSVLLIVSGALRAAVTLINQLQLLKVVSDINERNCFLVLTKAGRAGNGRLGEKLQQASEYDPKPYLDELAKHGVNFFEVGRNVACIDMGAFDTRRYDTIEWIRAALCDLRPLVVRQTYKELVGAANGNLKDLANDRARTEKMIELRREDLAWHQRRKRDMTIGALSTAWIPILGQIAAIPMLFAHNDSSNEANKIEEEIKELENKLSSIENQKKDAAERLKKYEALIQEVQKIEEREAKR
ncbi:hypothetical protein H9P43_003375 [Blastocladiella emersonii ATCC 22665]|nr:hypothetical protein H9P43_003375 [Blastocladiella emersonii ATCC 22665]